MGTRQYTYVPLASESSIRVLVLDAAENLDDDLKCDLIHLDRSQMHRSVDRSANHYEAVSYTSGESVLTAELFCPGNSVLKITPHVDAMLRRLRKSHRPRNLWVDAICINQHDNQEKGQQVARMGGIYQQALKVILWLGDEDQDVKSVFAFIRALSILEPPGLKLKSINALLQKTWGDTSWRALDLFLRRPWFGRRWVLQEAALARTAVVKCHDQKLPWVYFSSALCNLGAAMEQPTSLSKEAVDALGTLQSLQRGRRHLMELLWDFEHCQCFDKRDRIFALLGFADDIARRKRVDQTEPGKKPAGQRLMNIEVDYKATWETVYIRFASECIAQGYAFELLKHMFAFGTLRDKDDALPSWVPNWANKRMEIDTRRWPGGINITGLSMAGGGKEIALKGPICWATVRHVLPVPGSPGAQPSHEEILQWLKSIPRNAFGRLVMQKCHDLELLSKQPRSGLLPEELPSEVHLLAICLKELLILSGLSSTVSSLNKEINTTPAPEIAILSSFFQQMPLDMGVIILGSGRLGIDPLSSERGDAVGCLSSTDNVLYGYIIRANDPLDDEEQLANRQCGWWPAIEGESLQVVSVNRKHGLPDNDSLCAGRIVGRFLLSKDKLGWVSDSTLEEMFRIS